MKTTISKLISALAVATVLLSANLATAPTPIPESNDSVPVIKIESEPDKNKDGGEGNKAQPQFDEPIDNEDRILQ